MIELDRLKPVPVEFIHGKTRLSWREAVWGLEKGWLGWRSLVELARSKDATKGDDATLLKRLQDSGKDESHEVADIARRLAAAETAAGDPAEKWLYIVLSWLSAKREDIPDYWTVVEEVYAEFDYPQAMRKFVRYEPVAAEDMTGWSSHQNPEDYLHEQWQKFLDDAAKKYASPR